MPVSFADIYIQQLHHQAMMFDLSTMSKRSDSAYKISRFFVSIQEELGTQCCIEIGAHEATFSRNIKRLYPSIKTFAYEANPHVWQNFNSSLPFTEEGIIYENMAISNKDGKAEFRIYKQINGKDEPIGGKRHSLLQRIDFPVEEEIIKIDTARLDTLFDQKEQKFSLWIDAEGASDLILEGADRLLQKTVSIYMEVESIAKFAQQKTDVELVNTLLNYDFVPIARDFQFANQYNIIFVKRDLRPLIERKLHLLLQRNMRFLIQDHSSAQKKSD